MSHVYCFLIKYVHKVAVINVGRFLEAWRAFPRTEEIPRPSMTWHESPDRQNLFCCHHSYSHDCIIWQACMLQYYFGVLTRRKCRRGSSLWLRISMHNHSNHQPPDGVIPFNSPFARCHWRSRATSCCHPP